MNQEKEPVKEEELIRDAFAALGGDSPGTGLVDVKNLVQLIQKDFGLEINIEKLLNNNNNNKSGNQTFLNFENFKAIMFK